MKFESICKRATNRRNLSLKFEKRTTNRRSVGDVLFPITHAQPTACRDTATECRYQPRRLIRSVFVFVDHLSPSVPRAHRSRILVFYVASFCPLRAPPAQLKRSSSTSCAAVIKLNIEAVPRKLTSVVRYRVASVLSFGRSQPLLFPPPAGGRAVEANLGNVSADDAAVV